MTEQEQPRCPYCDVPLTKSVDLGFANPYMFECLERNCKVHLRIFGPTEADCIRQASNLKLVDRVKRDAVKAEREACADEAWEHACKGYHENCNCSSHISQAIRARNQAGDETKEKGTT